MTTTNPINTNHPTNIPQHHNLPPNLTLPTPHRNRTILPPLRKPPFNPHLHLTPTCGTAYINRRHDLLDPQGTHKHGKLAERAMLRVRDTETGRFARGAALGC